MKQIELLEKIVHGEIEATVEEYGERVLRDPDDHEARAVLNIITSDDRLALWDRLKHQVSRIYGIPCEATIRQLKSRNDYSNFACMSVGCTELAIYFTCDSCASNPL